MCNPPKNIISGNFAKNFTQKGKFMILEYTKIIKINKVWQIFCEYLKEKAYLCITKLCTN